MSREWEPGDVARVRNGNPITFYVREDEGGEVMFTNEYGYQHPARHLTPDARPLVVIDPEDREQVERLVNAYEGTMRGDCVAEMQHALREFANPKPQRIDEPGTWGVVEAACVHSDIEREWVRFPSGNWHAVRKMPGGCEDIENPDDWDSLIDPVLVREGVS